MLFAALALPFWLRFARSKNKQLAYVFGILFFVFVEILIFVIQPGQMSRLIVLGAFSGSVFLPHISSQTRSSQTSSNGMNSAPVNARRGSVTVRTPLYSENSPEPW